MERFVCNLHAYSAYSQYMADGRSKMRQEFWSFRGFRTKQKGLECSSGFSHSIPHDNEMLIKQNGNLRKRHYIHTHAHIYIYMRCKCTCQCTCILDVSKRGVLGSADAYSVFFSDHVLFLLIMRMFLQIPAYSTYSKYDIAFLHIVTVLIVHGKVCLQYASKICIFAVHGGHGTVENASSFVEF